MQAVKNVRSKTERGSGSLHPMAFRHWNARHKELLEIVLIPFLY